MRTGCTWGDGMNAASAAIVAMYRSSSGRSSLSSSGWFEESRSSGSRNCHSAASTSGSTRGRSPRRSRSPSPRGRRRRRSPSSSRSSRRSPSPRRRSRVRSPSGDRRSRRSSEQRDGSLTRRHSPGRHSCSSQRHPQFLGSCSPSRYSESSVEQSLWPEFGSDPREQRRLSDRLGSPDNLNDADRGYLDDNSVFIRGLSRSRSLERYHSYQESPRSSFSTRYDKDYCGRDAFLHQSDCNMNEDHLQDLPRESDRDGKLFTKSLHPSEEEGLNPKYPQYDREDRLLDVSTDPQDSLSEKRNYYKRSLSRSQSHMYPDEDFRQLVSARRTKEQEELNKNTSRDSLGSDYMICGLTNSLQSSESRHLYRPDEAPVMPKKSILKKRVDDPSMQPTEQNFGNFLRQRESTSESADLHSGFLLPHERASQDGSGFSHILGRMADSTSAQEKCQHSFLDVEDEEKFLYDDDEDYCSINCSSTEKLTMKGGKESVTLNKRPPSPIQNVQADSLEGSRIEYEKIHDLLKTVGLDIGVADIDKGAARIQEWLHGKKTLRSVGGHSVVSYKPDYSEKDCFQSNTHSAESHQKNSLSVDGSSQPSNDVSSASVSEHAESKTVGYNNSAGTPERSFPPVSVTPSAPPPLPNLPLSVSSVSRYSVTPSAPPSLPNLPPYAPPGSQYSVTPSAPPSLPNLPPYVPPVSRYSVTPSAPPLLNLPPSVPPASQYSVSHFSAFPAGQILQNYPPPTMAPPSYNAYRHCMAYSVPPWPMHAPPQQSNRALPGVRVSGTLPSQPTRSNLRVIETVSTTKKDPNSKRNKSTVKKNPEIKRNQSTAQENSEIKRNQSAVQENPEIKRNMSVLVQVPITPTDSTVHSQSSTSGTIERISDEKNPASEKPQVMDEREKLKGDQEAQQRQLQYLKTELVRVSTQQGRMLKNKRRVNCEDPLLAEVKRAQHDIVDKINRLQAEIVTMEKKQSEFDKECLNKDPLCEEGRNLDHQAELTPIQETECSLKWKQCEKQEEDRDERSAKVARKEKSETTKELGEEGNENEISKGKEGFHGQKLTVTLVLKKGDIQIEKKEGEKEESQKVSGQLPSEKCSLRKTETNNPHQDVAAPKAESAKEGKCRERKSQSGNLDSKKKITVSKAETLGKRTKKQARAAGVAKVQQQFMDFDSPHCPPSLFSLPSGPPPSLFSFPGSGLPYNMCIPPFSDSLLFTLHKATEERTQKKKW